MIKIAVCIKQVPAHSEGKTDPVTGIILREKIKPVFNIYDLSALETALQIKDKMDTVVDVFSMGPERAVEVIREAYTMGADKGFLISDKNFSGADVLATSYTLMQAIKSTDRYDLIICGRQTTDGDTAQVSGSLAKWLDIPCINWISKIESVNYKEIILEQTMEREINVVKVKYPCLISVEKTIYTPRLPSLKLKISAKKKEIKILKLENLKDTNKENYGLLGSPTRVKKISPSKKTKKEEVMFGNKLELANKIFRIIQKIKTKEGKL